jgi:hypothetical protein
MNFAFSFIIGRQLAVNQGVSTQQATSDGLVSAMLRQPLGLVLALTMARNQVSSTTIAASTAANAGSTSADVPITLNFPVRVSAKHPVTGTVSFANNGPATASDTSFSLTVPTSLTHGPKVHGLPQGATASFNRRTGLITFLGMPSTVAPGITIGPITVSFTPSSAAKTVPVTAAFNTAAGDYTETVKTTITR